MWSIAGEKALPSLSMDDFTPQRTSGFSKMGCGFQLLSTFVKARETL